MKNSFKAILAVLMVATLTVGCSNVEKILPKKDGKWKIVSVKYEEYVNNTLDSTAIEPGVGEFYEFVKDGTGTFTDPDTSYAFEWSVNDDKDEVTMCVDFFGGGTQFCFTNTVLTSEKNNQTWFYSDKVSGDVNWIDQTVELERVE